jgi:hypothetical protein
MQSQTYAGAWPRAPASELAPVGQNWSPSLRLNYTEGIVFKWNFSSDMALSENASRMLDKPRLTPQKLFEIY